MASQSQLKLRIPARPTQKRRRSDSRSDSEPESSLESCEGDETLVVLKTFCSFCGDHMGDQLNVCVDCGSYMCEQTDPKGPGCIWVGTVNPEDDFRCIVCEPKYWKAKYKEGPARGDLDSFPFGFIGYGGRRRSKLTWPLVFACVTLSSLPDTYVPDALRLDLRNHFMTAPENLCLVKVKLAGNGQKKAQVATTDGIAFIQRSILSDVPANTFVLVDTHSDAVTGELQWSRGSTGPKNCLPSELIRKFCGDGFLQQMKVAADKARGLPPHPPQAGWYDDSAFSRGGWRGLLLSTCAPTMRVPESFQNIRGLVERQVLSFFLSFFLPAGKPGMFSSDTFDFVLGFAGSSTIPSQVRGALSQVIERIGIDKTGHFWDTFVRVIGH
ncbi:hypothetical protein HD554DRAFT_2176882 [Boletus coccyginus]|nr:hypothetical protein HD554DRAFT_2176882 [Boletus coccyginus]